MDYFFYICIVIIFLTGLFLFFFYKKPSNSNDVKDLYYEALDLMLVGKKKSAYKIFKDIINYDSNNIKAYLYLGQILRESGDSKGALKIHKALLLRDNLNNYDLILIYKNLSLDYYYLEDLEESITYCDKILELNKSSEWSVLQVIKLYKQLNDWPNAIKYLKLLFEIRGKKDNKKLALYKIQEGRILVENSLFEKARDSFEKALEIDSNLYVAYYFIGNSYATESNEVYEKGISIDTQNIDNSLSMEEESQQYKIEAEKILKNAIPLWVDFIEHMPEYSWMILPTLKDALQALDEYEKIEKYLIQVNRSNPNNVDILSHLADFYANKGDVNKAGDTINKALEVNSSSLIAQLKSFKIKLLNSSDKDFSIIIDKIISSLLKDKRYKQYKRSFSDKEMKWLFNSRISNEDKK